jgi:hypothetical protein
MEINFNKNWMTVFFFSEYFRNFASLKKNLLRPLFRISKNKKCKITLSRNFWQLVAEPASGSTLNATANLQSELLDLKKIEIKTSRNETSEKIFLDLLEFSKSN